MIIFRRFALPLAATLFLAAAPAPVKTQVPGYYRIAVGALEVTALYDGNLRISPSTLHGLGGKAISVQLAREFADTNEKGVRTPINAYLVNTGDHLILVDGGSAGCSSSDVGHLVPNLRAAGYRPEDVDAVLITHMHGDHVCGLSAGGVRVYPNATVYASEEETAYWLSPPNTPNGPTEKRKDNARSGVGPYQAAGAFKTFKPGAVLFAGVTAMDTRGHTPGHISYLFESGDQGFLAMGDIVHAQAVQFVHPEVTIDYDTDQKAALPARKALFQTLVQRRWLFGATHLQFPGIGHIRKDGKAYTYVPVEYGPLP
jgi:glyoxylase-like metal-dependent hydrolase (beta-lactamase superfamily II)